MSSRNLIKINRIKIKWSKKRYYIRSNINNILMIAENNVNKVKIKVSEILAKCRRKEDWVNFSRELGN